MKKLVLSLLFLLPYFLGNSQIIFNEVQADAGNFENAGSEWIEIKNVGFASVDLSCWKISNGSFELVLPAGLILVNNAYLLIGNASKMMCSTCDYKELNNLFTLNSDGFGLGSGEYDSTIFLNTDLSSNGGCGCLNGSGTLNNGSGTGDRLVLFDDAGNVVDAMMYGGGNNYGAADLTVNFSNVTSCPPLPGVVVPNTSSSVYDGRIICNDVSSCNSSFARVPDGNNGLVVSYAQTGNLACTNCTNPCGVQTNTASNDMPTPGLHNEILTWQALLNGNPVTTANTAITVCGVTPITFAYKSFNFSNTALSHLQPTGQLGSYTITNSGTPQNFTSANFDITTGITTLIAVLTPGAGTTTYTFVMGESNSNCSACPGTTLVSDVNNNASAAKECYITRTVTVLREEPLGGTPAVTCSILGSITVSSATGTNRKYELQKQTTVGGPFVTIAGPQNNNLFSGVVDDDADPVLPNYQVLVTTQNTVCSNLPTLTTAVPITCLGNPVCATYVSTNPGAPTFNPPSGSTVCASSPVQFTVDITGVCTNGTVDLLYDYNPAFDPYVTGTLMGSAPTTVGITPPTTTATGKIFINEFVPRPPQGACPGSPNGQNPNSGEWIELYNVGPGNVDIGGWIISDGDWTATIPAGTMILANNYFLIGGGGTFCSIGQLPDLNVETCNCTTVSPSTQDPMNLTDGAEQIALFDCSGTLIDAVLWNNGQALPDATNNIAWATGCGNYIVQKNVTLPAAISFTNSGGSLSGNPNVGRYRTAINNWNTITTNAITDATPKAANPGGNWTGANTGFGSVCPPPPVTATITVNLPDTCDEFNATNLTVKAIYKPDPVTPCTKSAVTATASYTIPSCSLLTLSGDGEYCVPNKAPITLTPSLPLVGNYNVLLGNGTNTLNINSLTGAGPFIDSVLNGGIWTINSINPPTGVCAPKKVGSANIIIHPIPVITSSPTSVGSCYLYGYDLSNINLLMTTNPPANTFTWYDSLVGGNQIFPTLVYPTGPTIYYAEPTTGSPSNCNGTRVPVLLDVTPIPDVPAVQCSVDTLIIIPPAQNCVPTTCQGVEYSANGINWSTATAYTSADPGWNGWGVTNNSQLYIRNIAQNNCYVIITYFSPCAAPLPTTLFAFSGHLLNNNTVQLHWKTEAEKHVRGYTIEQSIDNLHFEKIGWEPALGKESNEYIFIDEKPLAGINYYRIKIEDEDGKFVYSNTIAVNMKVDGTHLAAVYPIPSVNNLYAQVLSSKKVKAQIQVLDLMQRVVYDNSYIVGIGTNVVDIPTNMLAAGNYVLKCSFGKEVEYRKFSKQ